MLRTEALNLAVLFKQTKSASWTQWLTGSWGADSWPTFGWEKKRGQKSYGDDLQNGDLTLQWFQCGDRWTHQIPSLPETACFYVVTAYRFPGDRAKQIPPQPPQELLQKCVTEKVEMKHSREWAGKKKENRRLEGHRAVDQNCDYRELDLRILEAM